MCQCVRLMRKQFKDVCVCVFQTVFPVLAHAGRKVGQFIRPFNPLSAKPIIWVLLLLFYSIIYSYI